MKFRNILLSILVLCVLGFCGYGAFELHRIETDVSQAAQSFTRVANKAGVAVDAVSTRIDASVGKIGDDVTRLTDTVNTTAGKLDGDVNSVSVRIDSAVTHVDQTVSQAVDRTGESVSKAVTSAVSPLPTAPPLSAVSKLFK